MASEGEPLSTSLVLRPEEPAAGPWERWPLQRLADVVATAGATTSAGPLVVAVDGRGASGKSTLATRLAAEMPDAVVIGTDDVAWHHSFFDWVDLLIEGVLAPAAIGRAVSFRPPEWEERGRTGSIDVPAGTRYVIVEGTGASRRELDAQLGYRIWVQSDFFAAERRGIERDVAQGVNGNRAEPSRSGTSGWRRRSCSWPKTGRGSART